MACKNESVCPMGVMLDAAEELIKRVDHSDTQRNLGGIAITREAMYLVRERLDCVGLITDKNGQVNCSLRDAIIQARATATAPWPPAQYAVNLENGIVVGTTKGDAPANGTYL